MSSVAHSVAHIDGMQFDSTARNESFAFGICVSQHAKHMGGLHTPPSSTEESLATSIGASVAVPSFCPESIDVVSVVVTSDAASFDTAGSDEHATSIPSEANQAIFMIGV
jgi:hypothetical protein